jgi:hypothetical protein
MYLSVASVNLSLSVSDNSPNRNRSEDATDPLSSTKDTIQGILVVIKDD